MIEFTGTHHQIQKELDRATIDTGRAVKAVLKEVFAPDLMTIVFYTEGTIHLVVEEGDIYKVVDDPQLDALVVPCPKCKAKPGDACRRKQDRMHKARQKKLEAIFMDAQKRGLGVGELAVRDRSPAARLHALDIAAQLIAPAVSKVGPSADTLTAASRLLMEAYDGTKTCSSSLVEIEWSTHGGPPGAKGVYTQSSTLWARINGGPWQRARACRSQHKMLQELIKVLDLDMEEVPA